MQVSNLSTPKQGTSAVSTVRSELDDFGSGLGSRLRAFTFNPLYTPPSVSTSRAQPSVEPCSPSAQRQLGFCSPSGTPAQLSLAVLDVKRELQSASKLKRELQELQSRLTKVQERYATSTTRPDAGLADDWGGLERITAGGHLFDNTVLDTAAMSSVKSVDIAQLLDELAEWMVGTNKLGQEVLARDTAASAVTAGRQQQQVPSEPDCANFTEARQRTQMQGQLGPGLSQALDSPRLKARQLEPDAVHDRAFHQEAGPLAASSEAAGEDDRLWRGDARGCLPDCEIATAALDLSALEHHAHTLTSAIQESHWVLQEEFLAAEEQMQELYRQLQRNSASERTATPNNVARCATSPAPSALRVKGNAHASHVFAASDACDRAAKARILALEEQLQASKQYGEQVSSMLAMSQKELQGCKAELRRAMHLLQAPVIKRHAAQCIKTQAHLDLHHGGAIFSTTVPAHPYEHTPDRWQHSTSITAALPLTPLSIPLQPTCNATPEVHVLREALTACRSRSITPLTGHRIPTPVSTIQSRLLEKAFAKLAEAANLL